MLSKWRQLKDVLSFNEESLRILLDIPNISEEEQIVRYTRELKPYIWEEICTTEYRELSEAMADAERIDAAHRRMGAKNSRASTSNLHRRPFPPQTDLALPQWNSEIYS